MARRKTAQRRGKNGRFAASTATADRWKWTKEPRVWVVAALVVVLVAVFYLGRPPARIPVMPADADQASDETPNDQVPLDSSPEDDPPAVDPAEKADRLRLAGMLDGLAEMIEADGALPTPNLATVGEVGTCYLRAIELVRPAMDTLDLAAITPGMGEQLRDTLGSDRSVVLDETTRAEAVAVFRELAGDVRD